MRVSFVMDGPSQVKILLVEDNPADARLITDYFKNSETKIKHVSNGGIRLLIPRGDYKNDSLPDIVILDMNILRLMV
ncbi:MAG: hypothetical protein ACXVHO_07395 [Methanobacterium sp.]